MEGAELVADALGRINRILHRAMDGIPAETLNTQPAAEANSMSWLAWHLCRVQDRHISDLLELPQLWDEKETGTGHSPAQVEALQVDSADLPLGYADAVYERAKQYLATVKPADLDAAINEPQYDPLPTVGVRLVSIISDNIQHAGQVMYVRGLLERQGWLGV